MALIKKFSAQTADSTEGKSTAVVAREAEAQRKKARTLAKQQQAAQIAQMAKPMKEMAQAGKAMGETDGDNLKQLMSGMTGQ